MLSVSPNVIAVKKTCFTVFEGFLFFLIISQLSYEYGFWTLFMISSLLHTLRANAQTFQPEKQSCLGVLVKMENLMELKTFKRTEICIYK